MLVCRFRATPLEIVFQNIQEIIDWLKAGPKSSTFSYKGNEEDFCRPHMTFGLVRALLKEITP
jgi:hypothetical protein